VAATEVFALLVAKRLSWRCRRSVCGPSPSLLLLLLTPSPVAVIGSGGTAIRALAACRHASIAAATAKAA